MASTRPARAQSSGFRVLPILALTALAAYTLYRFPRLYPPCPIHALTGLLCPGCGATRALTALLHGHPAQALHHNPLLILLLPFLALYAAKALLTRSWPTLPTPALATLLTLTAAFTLYRNL